MEDIKTVFKNLFRSTKIKTKAQALRDKQLSNDPIIRDMQLIFRFFEQQGVKLTWNQILARYTVLSLKVVLANENIKRPFVDLQIIDWNTGAYIQINKLYI